MTFGIITQEDREKAKATKQAKIKWAQDNLFLDHDPADEAKWLELAKEYGVKMPRSYIPNTELKYLKRTMAHLGVDFVEYLDDQGCKTLKELVRCNNYNARAEIGLMLEWWGGKQG